MTTSWLAAATQIIIIIIKNVKIRVTRVTSLQMTVKETPRYYARCPSYQTLPIYQGSYDRHTACWTANSGALGN